MLLPSKHRHETPILNESIEVFRDDQSYLVVSKPSSIPVEVTTFCVRNSLLNLRKENLDPNDQRELIRKLYFVNDLD